jgi:glycosyltransferase involved in cell wall biosynthesis
MPVHNGGSDLPSAVDCMLAQTFPDFELVIIDDASTDSTLHYLARLRDPRVRILRNLTNLGIARSLNRGISESSGEYIARQDADDYSYPSRIEKQAAYLDAHPEVAVLATNYYIVDNGLQDGPAQRVFADLDIRFGLLFENMIAHTSVILRRSAVIAAGGYPEDCRLEDYELWLRIAEFAQFACLREPLVKWARRPDSYTNSDLQRTHDAKKSASKMYIRWLLGRDVPCELYDDFLALYRGGGKPLSPMSLERVRAATTFATQLQTAFYARAGCGPWAAQRHCARVRARWAGHLVSVALQGRRNIRWRAGLVANGLRLLMSPVMGSASTHLAVGAAPE